MGAAGNEGIDTATIQFGISGIAALVSYTAGCLVERMGPKALAERDINPDVARTWKQEGWDLAYDEAKQAEYDESEWRWVYGDAVSKWFTTRDAAVNDAQATYPEVGVG